MPISESKDAAPLSNLEVRVHHESIETRAVVDSEPVRVPRFLIEGEAGGPTLTITAAQHGRELNGIEAARRVIEQLPGEPLRGTVQVFPVVSPPSVHAVSQVVPGDTQNINRIWPGHADGTNTERIAAALAPLIVQADALVDLHGWTDWTVCATLCGSCEHELTHRMARAFGLPCTYCTTNGFQPGNLKTYAQQQGLLAIGAELTPQWRLSEPSVQGGVRGLMNVMRHLGMLPGEPALPETQWHYRADTPRETVNAAQAGLFTRSGEIGTWVEESALLGRLYDYQTLRCVQEVRAPIEGLLVNLGPCHNGVESNTVPEDAMLAEVWRAERW
ncbi:MAG: succinylglutamate desuccinylase/aspartoacylase family protein [Phycisphaeraceae bacterium]